MWHKNVNNSDTIWVVCFKMLVSDDILLKTGKSKDPYNLPKELFRPNVAGDDMILAITKLMNRIKNELIHPQPITVCNVTNLYKNKGLKQKYDSYRGIFRTPVLRNILDKLIYQDEYETIDQNLTNCNVGSRKGICL